MQSVSDETSEATEELFSTDIAVIGISCKFPGADNLGKFWDNLVSGVESIQRFSKEELRAEGLPEKVLDDLNYVPAKGIINDVDKFDANFFGYSPFDARKTDPQQKVFLEHAWLALESAGYTPEKCNKVFGVYASMSDSTYLKNNLLKNKDILKSMDWFQARIATSLISLSTQVSYRLNLTGPSINITTACSSSLVSIATACRGLIDYDCDIAIAGAVAISIPEKSGYLYQEGGLESPDGHCRAFDANAKGTVFSDGVGVVILKRLQDAIEEGDCIYAVIKGWNINNDGADKGGFTAPSSTGQAKCISGAMAFSDINPESIQYIEAHGTGTALGDVIELNALSKAFNMHTAKKQFCAIGSVKTNIGHADIAAGMAGFIKTIMALKTRLIPASLNFQEPNPKIDFHNSPFFVNTKLYKWPENKKLPRRAGVNSSGIGGTNAFLLLEEFKNKVTENKSRQLQLLLLSAKTKKSLEQQVLNLCHDLEKVHSHSDFADIAFTLQVGRADFEHRHAIICQDPQDAIRKLKEFSKLQSNRNHNDKDIAAPKIVFMFPGQGSQYRGMAKELYFSEPEFSRQVDECCEFLEPDLKTHVQDFIFGELEEIDENNTKFVQPALFILEYALAKFWMSLGIIPNAMIGHSLGEYVAACLAGVMKLQAAINLVVCRAKLMSETPAGKMLVVGSNSDVLLPFLKQNRISIAAINSGNNLVVSGSPNDINVLEENLKQQNIITHKLRVSHAFHSELMEPILEEFKACLEKVDFKIPNIPYISNLTGHWIEEEEVIKPIYWLNHLRHTVKFDQGLQNLMAEDYRFYLEIGPGKTLSNFMKETTQANGQGNAEFCIQNSLPSARDPATDQECFLQTIAQLWLWNVKIDWLSFYKHEKRFRVPLSHYPFQRDSYWIYPDGLDSRNQSDSVTKSYPECFYEPSWERCSTQSTSTLNKDLFDRQYAWVLFQDEEGIGDCISSELERHNQITIKIIKGNQFKSLATNSFSINPSSKKDYVTLVKSILKIVNMPFIVINLFSVTPEHESHTLNLDEVHKILASSFYSVLFFTQAVTEQNYGKNINILMVGNEICSVNGTEKIYPAKSSMIGPARVIPLEHSNIKIKILDILLSDLEKGKKKLSNICKQIIQDAYSTEFCSASNENIIAYRGLFRWSQIFKPVKIMTHKPLTLKSRGIYLITGGLGGISLTLAKCLARASKNPRLILVTRKKFLARSGWDNWLDNHELPDPISKKIMKLKEIEALGAKITLISGDISDFEQCKYIVERISKDFGGINGVLHAAGIASGGLVQLKNTEMVNKVFAAKVDGTYILTHLLQGQPLDFFVLCSSIITTIGVVGQVDYCAANACLDAFAFMQNFENIKVINWNTWRDVGMAVETAKPENFSFFEKPNDISPDQGSKIFEDLLMNPYPQLIISNFDFNKRSVTQNTRNTVMAEKVTRETREVSNQYLPPSNDIETALAKMWREVLGVDKVSIKDEFVKLGGHSLVALRLLKLIDQKFHIKMDLHVFQEITLENLAKLVSEKISLSTEQREVPVIIPIRSEGKEMPMFCLHPLGGSVSCYFALAMHLHHLHYKCPIYGLENIGPIEHNAYQSLEEMAAKYLQVIQKIRKHGPYLFCCFSFGAILAIEIARQLQRKGESVLPLILLEGWAKFPSKLQIEKMVKSTIQRVQDAVPEEDFDKIIRDRITLMQNYKIPVINTKVILFKAQDLLPEYENIEQSFNHWDKYAGEKIDFYSIPGNHNTILEEPNVAVLANKLKKVLIEVTSEYTSEKV